jgi:hypothetical protein
MHLSCKCASEFAPEGKKQRKFRATRVERLRKEVVVMFFCAGSKEF